MSERAPGSRIERKQFRGTLPSDSIGESRSDPMDSERFLNEVANHLRAVGHATLHEILAAIDIGVLRTPTRLRTILRQQGPSLGIVVVESVHRRSEMTKQNVYGLIDLDRPGEYDDATSANE